MVLEHEPRQRSNPIVETLVPGAESFPLAGSPGGTNAAILAGGVVGAPNTR